MKLFMAALPVIAFSAPAGMDSGSDLLLGPGSISLSATSVTHPIGSFINADEVCSADIDKDGDPDVAAANEDGLVWLWENMDGAGTVWSGRNVGIGSDYIGTVIPVDLDGDGSIDLVSGGMWFENSDDQGDSWIAHAIAGSGDPSSASAADIDGDSDSDVVLAYLYTNCIYWYENENGLGTQWSSHQITVPPFQSRAEVATGDLDGDGDSDIVLYEWGDPLYVVFCWIENTDGEGVSWTAHYLDDYEDSCGDLHTVDLDMDGDPDLLSACSNSVRLYLNSDGLGGSWSVVAIDAPAYGDASEVETADLDLDGDLDVACAYWYGSSSLVWWQNLDGSGLQWIDHAFGTGPEKPDGMCIDDIDGDGRCDIVVASSIALSWIELDSEGMGEGGGPAFFDLLAVIPNPCSGCPTFEFVLPAAGNAEISVFDISGRLAWQAAPARYPEGLNVVSPRDLRSGIHFVLVRAGEFEAAERFVVVE